MRSTHSLTRAGRALLACATFVVPLELSGAQGPASGPAPARPSGAVAPADTLTLGALHAAAERTDRRASQLELIASQSRLRLANLRGERWPALSLLGQAQYLSDVPSVGAIGPGGVGPEPPPNDNYDLHIALRQRILDPSSASRRAVERAQVAESEARVRTALYAQRSAVTEAFFAALLLDVHRETLDAAITDLAAQRDLASRRVQEGAALPSEQARLDAELLRRRQARAALLADRDATREVLATLIGREVPADAVLAVPAVPAAAIADARAGTLVAGVDAALTGRPEHAQFSSTRAVLAERRAQARALVRPRVAAFARAGYGRPGLNPLARDFDSYWLAGVQVEWTPWDWGGVRREQEVLSLQSEIVSSEEDAFRAGLERESLRGQAALRRVAAMLEADEAIVALHRGILDEARLRFTEGVITVAEFVDRQTDLLDAELARATHRVQLAEAHARLQTTLGREVR